ncbi:MAG: hypothetical protein ABIU97_11290 [Dehalococcoidia bacterium]
METKNSPNEVSQITSGMLHLKPDDATKLGKIEPGMMVRIVITGEVRDLGMTRPQGDSAEYLGELGFDVKTLTLTPADNQFQAMSREEDD